MEGALYDTPVLRRFLQLSGLGNMPDETAILSLRRSRGARPSRTDIQG
jgi:hypothetical protein